MPAGVYLTLGVRLVECHLKASKMLYVQKPPWPDVCSELHWTQGIFAHVTVLCAVGWHTALTLITYNPNVSAWGARTTILIWFCTSICVAGLLYAVSLPIRMFFEIFRKFIWKKTHTRTSGDDQGSSGEHRHGELTHREGGLGGEHGGSGGDV